MSGSKRDVWRPTLESAVRMAPEGPPPLIRRGMMPTLTVMGNYNRKGLSAKSGDGLNTALRREAGLPTLTARDGRSGKNKSCWSNSRPLSEVVGGLLNPTWCEWFMGFPEGWTESGPSGTP